MDRTRKATREGNEATLQHLSQPEALRLAEIAEENLTQLQAAMVQLQQTPAGAADLQARIKAFGECQRSPDETSSQFFDKLRHWLDRVIPQTKLPLHRPRQVE